jgi:hypothetical protein
MLCEPLGGQMTSNYQIICQECILRLEKRSLDPSCGLSRAAAKFPSRAFMLLFPMMNVPYPRSPMHSGNLQSFTMPVPITYPSPRSPHRPSVSTARTPIHNNILLPSVFLRRRGRRQVPRHAGHQRLCVFPLRRGSVGRVAGLLCERVACPLGCG